MRVSITYITKIKKTSKRYICEIILTKVMNMKKEKICLLIAGMISAEMCKIIFMSKYNIKKAVSIKRFHQLVIKYTLIIIRKKKKMMKLLLTNLEYCLI